MVDDTAYKKQSTHFGRQVGYATYAGINPLSYYIRTRYRVFIIFDHLPQNRHDVLLRGRQAKLYQ
jgi:hypothetical protein